MPSHRDVRNVLTPETLAMVQTIASMGSFAAAARELGLVPSTLTYRVRQLEDQLDVLLFDRSARQAVMTEAGRALLAESERLLTELDAIANRVRRVATGWEPQLTIALDGVIRPGAFLDLCEQFYTLEAPGGPPTQLRVREEILSGCWLALKRGAADLVLGAVEMPSDTLGPEITVQVLGDQRFVFCVAPGHPLAQLPTPLTDADLVRHRAVVVADSGSAGQRMSVGLLSGQPTFTVSSLTAKLEAMVHGLGGGFMPEWLVAPALARGELLELPVARRERVVRLCMAWRHGHAQAMGKALQWWIAQLQHPVTRAALLGVAPGDLTPEGAATPSPNAQHIHPELRTLAQRGLARPGDAADALVDDAKPEPRA
ncbi:hypothetical protein CCO03_12340 [Comamonas serinivorans]|uniref:HTH lysR-type domain-containing protein n=1 Tax=Comamonas serinivorans TaxID=1082851 RepID=A0A1Y0EPJ9_9BURK|nr:LysR family transcriptional regulator [Comamonas serinivorans]ARU05370.1 hypothetical protein CCO03_12340 [Comamonas serinivorans]